MSYHHIYNRGAHKVPIFYDRADYVRMIKLLFIANCSTPFHLRHFGESNIFEVARTDTLVDIVCYCLMPNHIHIALKPKSDLKNDHGITKFMRKLCTAYSMYFNLRYDHSGTIWEGGFKKKISDDEMDYMKTLIDYIHLNPYAIKEPNMSKEERKEHPADAYEYSKNYDFSSFKDYLNLEIRPQRSILCEEEVKIWLNAEVQPRHQ
jgi:REP element-mobilizing transposase RayT